MAKDPIETKRYVFRRTDSNRTGIVSTVRVSDLDLEPQTEYELEILEDSGQRGTIKLAGGIVVNTSKDGETITIPLDDLESRDAIMPGVSSKLEFYPHEGQEHHVIDTAKVSIDTTNNDGCNSQLHSPKASDYVDNNGKRTNVIFRNTRNGKTTTAETHTKYKNKTTRLLFPVDARKDIDANVRDKIEIIKPKSENTEDESIGLEKLTALVRENNHILTKLESEYMGNDD